MSNNLNYYITKYFSEYLPLVKGVSKNTIISYRDTFVSLITYLKEIKKVSDKDMNVNILRQENIEDFLLYLEETNSNSVSTRNQRLACIRTFCKYLKNKELSYFEICSNIQSIPNKKTHTRSLSYFSVEEIEILINTPNTKEKAGFRDYVLLLFMYETACRAQELCDLKINNLNIITNSYVILNGKGNKERKVPLSENLKNILIKYIKEFNIADDEYIFKNKYNKQFTTKGIEYTLKKYIKIARRKNSSKFKDNYSNHSMRHTRAMHLLESGVNLIYIRDILGHTSITTTEIYAKTNPIIKEQQILEHTKTLDAKCKYSNNQKEDLLNYLKQL